MHSMFHRESEVAEMLQRYQTIYMNTAPVLQSALLNLQALTYSSLQNVFFCLNLEVETPLLVTASIISC